jgi:hypothetical protein
MGIEPTSEAWEASILPLYDARSFRFCNYTRLNIAGYRRHTIAQHATAGSEARVAGVNCAVYDSVYIHPLNSHSREST